MVAQNLDLKSGMLIQKNNAKRTLKSQNGELKFQIRTLIIDDKEFRKLNRLKRKCSK